MQLKGKYSLITNVEYELFEIGRRTKHVLNCNFVISGRRKKKKSKVSYLKRRTESRDIQHLQNKSIRCIEINVSVLSENIFQRNLSDINSYWMYVMLGNTLHRSTDPKEYKFSLCTSDLYYNSTFDPPPLSLLFPKNRLRADQYLSARFLKRQIIGLLSI